VVLGSCVSLLHITNFSDASGKALKKYDEIDFSATHYCQAIICLDPLSYSRGAITQILKCDCKEFLDADKAIDLVNTVLLEYFDELKKLSDKNGVKLSYNDLASLVNTLSANMKLGLSADEVKATKDVSTQFSAILLSGWRTKKMRGVVNRSNGLIAVVIDAQRRNITFLRKILGDERSEVKAAYSAMADKTSDIPVKFLLNLELSRRDSALLEQDRLLGNFSSSLEQIKEGHQMLYVKRSDLKAPDFVKSLFVYTSGLSDLLQDFNNLKK
jgi:hypothetical protein